MSLFEIHIVMKSNNNKLNKEREQLSKPNRNVANKSYCKTSHQSDTIDRFLM